MTANLNHFGDRAREVHGAGVCERLGLRPVHFAPDFAPSDDSAGRHDGVNRGIASRIHLQGHTVNNIHNRHLAGGNGNVLSGGQFASQLVRHTSTIADVETGARGCEL